MKYSVIGDEDTVLGFGIVGVLGKIATNEEETRRAFREANIRLVELETPLACRELNRLFAEGANVAGGLHLTC